MLVVIATHSWLELRTYIAKTKMKLGLNLWWDEIFISVLNNEFFQLIKYLKQDI